MFNGKYQCHMFYTILVFLFLVSRLKIGKNAANLLITPLCCNLNFEKPFVLCNLFSYQYTGDDIVS